jgi:hypothetical protein
MPSTSTCSVSSSRIGKSESDALSLPLGVFQQPLTSRSSMMSIIPIARTQFTKTSAIEDPLLKVPPASRGNRTHARFPSRSGGNLQEGGNCNINRATRVHNSPLLRFPPLREGNRVGRVGSPASRGEPRRGSVPPARRGNLKEGVSFARAIGTTPPALRTSP